MDMRKEWKRKYGIARKLLRDSDGPYQFEVDDICLVAEKDKDNHIYVVRLSSSFFGISALKKRITSMSGLNDMMRYGVDSFNVKKFVINGTNSRRDGFCLP